MESSENRDGLSTGRENIFDATGGRDGRRHLIAPRGRQISETVVVDAMKRSVGGVFSDPPRRRIVWLAGIVVGLVPMEVAEDQALGSIGAER